MRTKLKDKKITRVLSYNVLKFVFFGFFALYVSLIRRVYVCSNYGRSQKEKNIPSQIAHDDHIYFNIIIYIYVLSD